MEGRDTVGNGDDVKTKDVHKDFILKISVPGFNKIIKENESLRRHLDFTV